MIRHLGTEHPGEIDFVPQAVIGRSRSYFEKSLRIRFSAGDDDLDRYEEAAFLLNDDLPFVLRHYAGHPANTTTLYLPRRYQEVDQITSIVGRIIRELSLDRDDVVWQRADDPEL
jgi:hypothetical protein